MFIKTKRLIFLILGIISTVLAIIGVILPLLPTTPFLILSAYLFSKSSNKLHLKLLNHRVFGPTIKNWEEDGTISVRAKLISSTMIIVLFSYTVIFVDIKTIIKVVISCIEIAVLAFIWTRPSSALTSPVIDS